MMSTIQARSLLHARLWEELYRGQRAPFHAVEHDPPVDRTDAHYSIRLTTGRRWIPIIPVCRVGGILRRCGATKASTLTEDGKGYDILRGEWVRVSSRRGSILARCTSIRAEPGLAFMTFTFRMKWPPIC